MASTTETLPLAELPFAPYRSRDNGALEQRIATAKQALGRELLILGHHYQQDEVIRFADLTGDSYKLSQLAAANRECRWIVFCGVHFMAETADVLANSPQARAARAAIEHREAPPHPSPPPQRGSGFVPLDGGNGFVPLDGGSGFTSSERVDVILPDLGAGCSMADMADLAQVEGCWEELGEYLDTADLMPVTYINSAANLKAFCGERGGIVCTSSNAEAVLRWSLARRSRVLFFPDQHLGRNTAKRMGIPLEEMVVWDPYEPLGGNTPEALRRARVLLWKGHCSVHQMFRPEHVDALRAAHAGIRILVHPECMMEVVDKADLVGSTEFIRRTIAEAPAGSKWAIGTELHLVNRLKQKRADCEIHFLSPLVCMCATMYRIDLAHLAWALENLARGVPVNVIRVPDDVAEWARVSLERMLEVRA